MNDFPAVPHSYAAAILPGKPLYLLNAAYTGQICAGTIHAPSASKALNKLVDYAMYASRYSRSELLKMMECFRTVVFMKGYRVSQIYDVTGWNEERQELKYTTLYHADGINQMHLGNHAGGESISAPHIRHPSGISCYIHLSAEDVWAW